jgi:hypothetical protein
MPTTIVARPGRGGNLIGGLAEPKRLARGSPDPDCRFRRWRFAKDLIGFPSRRSRNTYHSGLANDSCSHEFPGAQTKTEPRQIAPTLRTRLIRSPWGRSDLRIWRWPFQQCPGPDLRPAAANSGLIVAASLPDVAALVRRIPLASSPRWAAIAIGWRTAALPACSRHSNCAPC